jgi:hypothetical protein
VFCTVPVSDQDPFEEGPCRLLLVTVPQMCALDYWGMIKGMGSRVAGGGDQHHARYAVELQHGIGVNGNWHPCVKGHYPK